MEHSITNQDNNGIDTLVQSYIDASPRSHLTASAYLAIPLRPDRYDISLSEEGMNLLQDYAKDLNPECLKQIINVAIEVKTVANSMYAETTSVVITQKDLERVIAAVDLANMGNGHKLGQYAQKVLRYGTLGEIEYVMIISRLVAYNGSRKKTAYSLQMGARTLGVKLRQLRAK